MPGCGAIIQKRMSTVVTLLVLLHNLLNHGAESYIGVIRQSNGTDIELRTWDKATGQCGETTVLSNSSPLVIYESVSRCGYVCQWLNGEPYSSYTTAPGGALSCSKDKDIRQGKFLWRIHWSVLGVLSAWRCTTYFIFHDINNFSKSNSNTR